MATIGFVVATLLHACTIFPTMRYRITLYLDVDGKPVEASSVSQISDTGNFPSMGQKFCGQALTVDLGSRGVLAMVFESRDDNSNYWANILTLLESLDPHVGDRSDYAALLRYLATLPDGTGVDFPWTPFRCWCGFRIGIIKKS